MSELLPLSVPSIQGNEWKYMKACLETEWISSAGKYVVQFEEEIANYIGAKYTIACVNGTAALQVALRTVGVQPGDEVIVPTLTFIATVNVVRYLNAEPILMDCDPYYNLDVEKTIEFITHETEFKKHITTNGSKVWSTFNKKTNARIAAIIPVHIFGNAVDLERLAPICQERHIKIVEDAAESLGTVYSQGVYRGRHPGTIGDVGCLSFNGNKIITTGGGGMIVTNHAKYARQAKYLTTQAKDDDVRYIHNEIGYNFRLTNIQAAIGVAQLERLPEYLASKKTNYGCYKEMIDSILGLHLAEVPDYADNNYWMYALQIDQKTYGKDREAVMQLFSQSHVQTRPVWYLNHLQKPYHDCQIYKIEKAVELWEKTLNIPCSVNLKEEDRQRVIECLQR